MFTELKIQEAHQSATPDETTFCILYPRFVAGTSWLESRTPTNRDKVDFFKQVVSPMDAAWAKLDHQARLRCCYRLKEYMPEGLYRVITMFNATVIKTH